MAVPDDPGPMSVDDVDLQFQQQVSRFHRARWNSVGAVLAVIIAGISYLGYAAMTQHAQLAQQEDQIRAACSFWRVIGTLSPLQARGQPPPGRTTIILVADSRRAYTEQDCSPGLPRPSAELVHYAGVYGLNPDGP